MLARAMAPHRRRGVRTRRTRRTEPHPVRPSWTSAVGSRTVRPTHITALRGRSSPA